MRDDLYLAMHMWPCDTRSRLGPILNYEPEEGNEAELLPGTSRDPITKVFPHVIRVRRICRCLDIPVQVCTERNMPLLNEA